MTENLKFESLKADAILDEDSDYERDEQSWDSKNLRSEPVTESVPNETSDDLVSISETTTLHETETPFISMDLGNDLAKVEGSENEDEEDLNGLTGTEIPDDDDAEDSDYDPGEDSDSSEGEESDEDNLMWYSKTLDVTLLNPSTTVIEVTDFSYSTYAALVNYLYTGSISFAPSYYAWAQQSDYPRFDRKLPYP